MITEGKLYILQCYDLGPLLPVVGLVNKRLELTN